MASKRAQHGQQQHARFAAAEDARIHGQNQHDQASPA
jgi:hypothetical protein